MLGCSLLGYLANYQLLFCRPGCLPSVALRLWPSDQDLGCQAKAPVPTSVPFCVVHWQEFLAVITEVAYRPRYATCLPVKESDTNGRAAVFCNAVIFENPGADDIKASFGAMQRVLEDVGSPAARARPRPRPRPARVYCELQAPPALCI